MPGSHAAPLLLLVNPACGDGTAAAFVATHVLPALKKGAAVPAAVLTTERPGHAGELVLDFLARAPAGSTALTVAVAGGDGTVHEVVHAVLERASGKPFEIEFVLIPVRARVPARARLC
jgi:diacylglycerol kinase family enzyme